MKKKAPSSAKLLPPPVGDWDSSRVVRQTFAREARESWGGVCPHTANAKSSPEPPPPPVGDWNSSSEGRQTFAREARERDGVGVAAGLPSPMSKPQPNSSLPLWGRAGVGAANNPQRDKTFSSIYIHHSRYPVCIAIHRKFQTRRTAEDSTHLYGEAAQHRMKLSVDGYKTKRKDHVR